MEELMPAVDKSLVEVPCTRTVAGDAFTAGVMDYNVNIGAPSVLSRTSRILELLAPLLTDLTNHR